MLELGDRSEALHRRSAEMLASADVDRIVATGLFVPAFEPLASELGDRLIAEPDPEAAFDPMAGVMTGDEVVLLKGSRGVALERLLPRLEARFGTGPAGEEG